jgi:tetratricopeptide (TPR) repeat protein
MNVLLAAVLLLAAGTKPEQIRPLAELPTIEVNFKFGFQTTDLSPGSTNDPPLRSELDLRALLEASPTNSAAWIDLGRQLTSRATSNHLHMQSINLDDVPNLVAAVRSGKLSRNDIRCAKQLLDEANLCFTKAIESEPNKPDGYVYRALCRWVFNGALQSVNDALNNKPSLFALPPDTTIADIQQAARLLPNDVKLQMAFVGFLLMSEAIINHLDCFSATGCGTDISPKTHAAIAENISRLRTLSSCNDPKIAATACQGLGIFDFMLNGTNGVAVQCLQRAITLNPTYEGAWDFLIGVYLTTERNDLLLAVCTDRLKTTDSIRNRYLLAKAHWRLHQVDKTEEHLRLILKRNPNDFLAITGMAAVMLRCGDPVKANEFLRQVDKIDTQSIPADQRADFHVLEAIHAMLNDYRVIAESFLDKAERLDPNNKNAKALRDAMKP